MNLRTESYIVQVPQFMIVLALNLTGVLPRAAVYASLAFNVGVTVGLILVNRHMRRRRALD